VTVAHVFVAGVPRPRGTGAGDDAGRPGELPSTSVRHQGPRDRGSWSPVAVRAGDGVVRAGSPITGVPGVLGSVVMAEQAAGFGSPRWGGVVGGVGPAGGQ
jgi:hypothetical protein